jgi:uncharacterized membrane protein (Fun14 family)
VILDYPIPFAAISFVVLALSGWFGAAVLGVRRDPAEEIQDDYQMILAATLTLLGLIIGFSFSMAISRYDQRKNLEEEEANAIGTAYVRADLLPAAEAARVRALLKEYVDVRMQFYSTRDGEQLGGVAERRAKLQAELWAAVQGPAAAQPTAVAALVVKGMNDVLNAQGYTQAAWWNRIPHAAWLLMMIIAICSNVLLGYGVHPTKAARRLLLVMPLVVSISFLLIADIDSPRGGVIHVNPQNLKNLAESLRVP